MYVNTAVLPAKVRIAISNSTTLALKDYIEFEVDLDATVVLERTGMVLGTGEMISVMSNTTGVVVRVHGLEEVA